ncbi:39S ribosomal protein L40, mitochondrial [Odontomachus brunneus]|uniref:39S ribosomal protein L40, mitochondrial n=1 Tax=Odontomachus brunneus TaxID=486640 RepID=UPI0013F24299|nr:39S ribosomal protein L40, mitochondrial [Odontomachus brunneus]
MFCISSVTLISMLSRIKHEFVCLCLSVKQRRNVSISREGYVWLCDKRKRKRMSIVNLLSKFSRLSVNTLPSVRNISTCTSPLYFRVSSVLLGEPLKRKKRLDPQIARARVERKKKKIEKQIRRLQKIAKQLKPISEVEVPFKLIDEKEQRLRHSPPLSAEEMESRILLQKKWNTYKTRQYLADVQMIDSMICSQQKALDELRKESEELYQEAIQVDLALLPYVTKGPSKTPPIENYESPDGEYVNTTRKYEGEE